MNEKAIDILHELIYDTYGSPRAFEQTLTDTLAYIIQHTEPGEERQLKDTAFLIGQISDIARQCE